MHAEFQGSIAHDAGFLDINDALNRYSSQMFDFH
jgi:hypothetical protein